MAEKSFTGRRQTRAEAASNVVPEPQALNVIARPVDIYVPPRREAVGLELLYASLARTSSRVSSQLDKTAEDLKEQQAQTLRGEWAAFLGDSTEDEQSIDGFRAWRQDQGRSGWLGIGGKAVISDAQGSTNAIRGGSQLLAEIEAGTFGFTNQVTGQPVDLVDATPGDISTSIDRAIAAFGHGLNPIAAGAAAIEGANYTKRSLSMAMEKKQEAVIREQTAALTGEGVTALNRSLNDENNTLASTMEIVVEQFNSLPGMDKALASDQLAYTVMSLASSLAADGQSEKIDRLRIQLGNNPSFKENAEPETRARVMDHLRTTRNDAERQQVEDRKEQARRLREIFAKRDLGETLSEIEQETLENAPLLIRREAEKDYYGDELRTEDAKAQYLVGSGQPLPDNASPLLTSRYEVASRLEVGEFLSNPEVKDLLDINSGQLKSTFGITSQGRGNDFKFLNSGIQGAPVSSAGTTPAANPLSSGTQSDWNGYFEAISKRDSQIRETVLNNTEYPDFQDKLVRVREILQDTDLVSPKDESTRAASNSGYPTSEREQREIEVAREEYMQAYLEATDDTMEELRWLINPPVPALTQIVSDQIIPENTFDKMSPLAQRELRRDIRRAQEGFEGSMRSADYYEKFAVGKALEDHFISISQGPAGGIGRVLPRPLEADAAMALSSLRDIDGPVEGSSGFAWLLGVLDPFSSREARRRMTDDALSQIPDVSRGDASQNQRLWATLTRMLPFVQNAPYDPNPQVPDLTEPLIQAGEE